MDIFFCTELGRCFKPALSLYPQTALLASGEISEHDSRGFFGVKKRHPYPWEQWSFGVKVIIGNLFCVNIFITGVLNGV